MAESEPEPTPIDPGRCQGKVWFARLRRFDRCTRRARVARGSGVFCGIHDPESPAKLARRQARPSVATAEAIDSLDPYPGERVRDAHGEFRCLAYAEGYVMCRRPRCVVVVKGRAEWLALRAAGREG